MKPELLAPAGNLKKLKYAIEFGADAVYCGVPDFSLRVRINQFDTKTLAEGIKYAHERGKKVYVTVNILAHNRHIKELPAYLKKLGALNPDALIISDPGIIEMVKEVLPKMEIHLSTQANCTNWRAAKFWAAQGVKRIILGREVTLDEIKEIRRKAPEAELEYFVHGAMCMSYSGRCLLSKYFTAKSANLGDCTQPCRWEYKTYLEEVKRPGDLLPIEEDQHGTYIMNSKDLCLIKYIEDLKKAGVASFKIEGRAKSIYYVAAASKSYRTAIDLLPWSTPAKKKKIAGLYKDMGKLNNRSYTTGFLFGKEKCEQKIDSAHIECDWEFCGEVLDKNGFRVKPGMTKKDVMPDLIRHPGILVQVHNALFKGDTVECVPTQGDNFKIKINKMFDPETGKEISEAHGGQGKIVLIKNKRTIPKMSILRKQTKL